MLGIEYFYDISCVFVFFASSIDNRISGFVDVFDDCIVGNCLHLLSSVEMGRVFLKSDEFEQRCLGL